MEAGRRALDFSIRAVDAYRKTLLIDKVTLDDERSPPVYILNEIADILRSCSLDLTQEIVEYTFRRLRHPSPQVKCKVLRFIKYTVNRAGSAAYRKELQSNAALIRELCDFQGQIDPFKGNALNKAVRDAAHEAIKAIFSSDGNLPMSKSINKRIEGFGNGNFSKAFINSYRSAAIDETERESLQHHGGNGDFDSVTCKQHHESESPENVNHKPDRESEKVFSPEEEILDKVTASQGLRLQPTHECLEFFLAHAKTLDAGKMGLAFKAKLRSPSWQVQLKTLCALQALLHEKGVSFLQAIETDGTDVQDSVQKCLLSPQTTLRKKAKEVFDSLQALKKAKNHKSSPNMPCDTAHLVPKPSLSDDRDASFLSTSPANTSDTHQVGDLLSFQNDDVTQLQAAKTSPNSVMDDPFDGMCIYGSNGSTDAHVDDLLSGGWNDGSVHRDVLFDGLTDSSVRHVDAPFETTNNEHNCMGLRTTLQSDAIKQNQLKTSALDSIFIPDFAAKSSTAIGKSTFSSSDNKTYLANSKGNVPDLTNLNALYMFPMGMAGSSHNIAALQQYPGGTHGFEFGIHNTTVSVNGQTAASRNAHGDIYFKEFGLSN